MPVAVLLLEKDQKQQKSSDMLFAPLAADYRTDSSRKNNMAYHKFLKVITPLCKYNLFIKKIRDLQIKALWSFYGVAF